MSVFTTRFGFSKYGGSAGGAISDNNYKFSTSDRDLLDTLLHVLETHTHTAHDALANPVTTPTAAVESTGGTLPPGVSYDYGITFLDQYGLETAASAVVTASTPDVANPPGLAAVTSNTTDTGALVSGNYAYYLTCISDGAESDPSPAATITLQPGQSTATVAIQDDTSLAYRIYRQGPADIQPYRIHETSAGDATYLDAGAVLPSDGNFDPTLILPMAGGVRIGTYKITVSLPEVGGLTGITAWRLYRRPTGGSFSSPALVHNVVETVNQDGTGGLVTSWDDDGSALMGGQPPSTSQTIASYPVQTGYAGPTVIYVANLIAPNGDVYEVGVGDDGTLNTTHITDTNLAGVVTSLLVNATGGELYSVRVGNDGTLTATRIT